LNFLIISLDLLLITTQATHWKASADGQSGTTILWITMKITMIMPLYLRGTAVIYYKSNHSFQLLPNSFRRLIKVLPWLFFDPYSLERLLIMKSAGLLLSL